MGKEKSNEKKGEKKNQKAGSRSHVTRELSEERGDRCYMGIQWKRQIVETYGKCGKCAPGTGHSLIGGHKRKI